MSSRAGEEQPHSAGTITRLTIQKKDAERVSVFIDQRYVFGIHQEVLLQFGLKKGDFLSVADQEAIQAADGMLRAKVVAIRYIGYKPRTVQEVRRKLRRSGFEEVQIAHAVERLLTLEYLNDEAYAKTYAQQRFTHKNYGPQRIRAELMKRGLGREAIDVALQSFEANPNDLVEAAFEVAEKRWSRLKEREPDARKRRHKLSSFLQRRGYTFDTIQAVLGKLESE